MYDHHGARAQISNVVLNTRTIRARHYSPENDDKLTNGELIKAATAYAKYAKDTAGIRDMVAVSKCPKVGTHYQGHGSTVGYTNVPARATVIPEEWPFDPHTFIRSTPRAALIEAAALLIAEVERIDREDFELFATSAQKAKTKTEALKLAKYEASLVTPQTDPWSSTVRSTNVGTIATNNPLSTVYNSVAVGP